MVVLISLGENSPGPYVFVIIAQQISIPSIYLLNPWVTYFANPYKEFLLETDVSTLLFKICKDSYSIIEPAQINFGQFICFAKEIHLDTMFILSS